MNMHVEPATLPRPAPLMSERRVGLIGAALAAIGPSSMALYTPAMPQIVDAFGTTDAAVKMSLSLYFAGFAVAQLICGPLSDGLGRRPVTIAFMVVYALASLLAVVSGDIEVLIAARFLQGVGAAAGIAIARALVRDLFAGEQSARIMNFIGIVLVVGPALGPTIGGLTMLAFGWHAIFIVMLLAGLGIAVMTLLAMRETVVRDVSRIRPMQLMRSYRSILAEPRFVLASLVNAGASGAIYAQATVLPFILMDRVGLTPAQFGIGMLMQTGGFLLGSLILRRLLPALGAFRAVPVGLAAMAMGSVLIAALMHLGEPTYLAVMAPIALYTFGVAFVMPGMTTAALAPFRKNAGAASAMLGFMQMGAGLAGGSIMALFGDPVAAFGIVIPSLGLTAIVAWLAWRSLPNLDPATAVAPADAATSVQPAE